MQCGVLIFSALIIWGLHHRTLLAMEDQGIVVSDDSAVPIVQSEVGAANDNPAPAEDHGKVQALLLPEKRISRLSRSEEKGKSLYEYYCSLCHGLTGNADGFNAFNLSVSPVKHNDATYMLTLSDAHIARVIRDGGAAKGRSPLMPPWGNVINGQDSLYLITFIRTLATSQ